MKTRNLLALVLGLSHPAPAMAQGAFELHRGVSIPVIAAASEAGRSQSNATRLQPRLVEGVWSYLIEPAESVEASATSAATGARNGALIGGALGLLVGLLAQTGEDELFHIGPAAIVATTAAGAAIGAVIGMIARPSSGDNWWQK